MPNKIDEIHILTLNTYKFLTISKDLDIKKPPVNLAVCYILSLIYGEIRSRLQLRSDSSLYRMRSCRRFGRPCQNSISTGRTKKPPQ